MKKVGDIITLRGSAPINTQTFFLNLSDGKFDTGYQGVGFDIAAPAPWSTYEIQAKIVTEETNTFTGANWYWSDVREIAWAMWGTPSANQTNYNVFIDPENMLIEDLYLQIYTTSGDIGDVNYMVQLQKYDISVWEGALGMVRNRAQGDPIR